MSSAAHYHADGNGNVTMLVGTGSPTIKAYYKYDPFGRTIGSAGSLVGVNAMRFSSKPVMGSSELYCYGYRFYDPSSQRWLNRDPIGENGGLNLYDFVSNDPLRYIDILGLDWIEYTGEKLTMYGGNLGDRSNPKQSCKATSGLSGFQAPQNTGLRDKGPIPEGDYSVNLAPDPNRVARADPNSGELTPHKDGGIEMIPKSYIRKDGSEVSYPGWGTWRAKLNPKSKTDTKKRSSFYLHNSKKGYSHGCIETCDGLLKAMKEYRDAGNKGIDVRVGYSDSSTYGGTDK
jgi:RHS repeat-associated protein